MACGTPVIGSNVGGIKFSVEDGKTGFLVPPENPDALAARIFETISEPALLKKMKDNATRRVNLLFTWPKIARQLSDVYRRISDPVEKNSEEQELSFIDKAFSEAVVTFTKTKRSLLPAIREAARIMTTCYRKEKKILVCGNGGSAAESQHLAAELVGRFELAHRKALPALALTADTSVVTAWSNDFGYDNVFARQVEAFGQKGDVLFCFSTSGQSENIIQAMQVALSRQMFCIALTGKGGGAITSYAHVKLVVPSSNTARIQELHLHILHTLCGLVESKLFGTAHAQVFPRFEYNGHSNGNGAVQKSI